MDKDYWNGRRTWTRVSYRLRRVELSDESRDEGRAKSDILRVALIGSCELKIWSVIFKISSKLRVEVDLGQDV